MACHRRKANWPESQQKLMLQALDEGRDADRFADGVRAQAPRKRRH